MKKDIPQPGDKTKWKLWFALFPVEINNQRVWLEFVYKRKVYYEVITLLVSCKYPELNWTATRHRTEYKLKDNK